MNRGQTERFHFLGQQWGPVCPRFIQHNGNGARMDR
jgi:hypothetical protein